MSSGSILDRLENARANMGIELTRLEKKIEEAESTYLNTENSVNGTVFKGYEGYLAAKDQRRNRQQRTTAKLDEYMFSLSSATSDVYQMYLEQEYDAYNTALASRKSYGQKGYPQKGYPQKGYAQKGRR